MTLRGLLIATLLLPVSTSVADEYRLARAFHVAAEPACMPALTQAPNGNLLVAFSTEWEPFPQGGVLKLVVSQDEGRTWSKPRTLWKDEDPRVTIQVANGMQTLSNGNVLLPVTWAIVPKRADTSPEEKSPHKLYDLHATGYRREVRLLRSTDNGESWVIEQPDLPKPWWRFGRLFETDGGRLIMPGSAWYVESQDFGKTWSQPISLGFLSGNETNIVEAANGSWFSLVRGAGGPPRRTFGTNFSRDRGRTWGAGRPAKVQGKMPDLLILPSGRILLAVGAEGLTDGSQVFVDQSRRSFCTLFISDDHGETWRRDLPLAPVDEKTSVVPGDSPVMCRLDGNRIMVVMQGIDRSKANDPLIGFSAGMSLIGNIIEPGSR